MNAKQCPKCFNTQMVNVTRGETTNRSFLQTAPFREKLPIDRYLCFGCGFTEEWLNPPDLEKAKKTYGREQA